MISTTSSDLAYTLALLQLRIREPLRQLATRFVICGKSLYKHLAYGILLLCLDQASIDRVMREVHARVCELHMEGHMLARKC